jgi:opacity protein-like surface antigen
MSGGVMRRPLTFLVLALALSASPAIAPAFAQARPRAAAPQSRSIQIGGYAMVGRFNFDATESFDAILGTSSGPIFGGGARVGLPFGGLFVEVGAWQFSDEGERVFVSNGTVYPLNIPVEITVTPLEVSGGWRFRIPKLPKLTPYAAGGFTSMRYKETSSFSTPAEDVDETFNGYHLFGGAEYKITRWLGAAGEVAWTTVPDALGEGGVSKEFNEDDLGGASFRFKITIGR